MRVPILKEEIEIGFWEIAQLGAIIIRFMNMMIHIK